MSIYDHELHQLADVLTDPRFGRQARTMGAELEMVLVDSKGLPARCNLTVLEALEHPLFVTELMSHQLEYNAEPHPLANRVFTELGAELQTALAQVGSHSPLGVEPALIGILPTLVASDLTPGHMTKKPRYIQLDATLRKLHKSVAYTNIGSLRLRVDSLSFQGANTSFQTHLSVTPSEFADTYNATQLTAALVMAVSGNSPCLLGHHPGQEARIPVFRQATRSRAPFGQRWVHDAPDLFSQVVEHYEPLLPEVDPPEDDQPFAALLNLRRLNSTVWYWNRPVYDPQGNLRIESRYLPSGPTVIDMMANAAFLIGLSLGLRDRMEEFSADFDFKAAKDNFNAAALDGLTAELSWPQRPPASARQLVLDHLDIAHTGLTQAGIDDIEATELLDIIEQRAITGQTGARWQRQRLVTNTLKGVPEPTQAMFNRYRRYSAIGAGQPVHQWRP